MPPVDPKIGKKKVVKKIVKKIVKKRVPKSKSSEVELNKENEAEELRETAKLGPCSDVELNKENEPEESRRSEVDLQENEAGESRKTGISDVDLKAEKSKRYRVKLVKKIVKKRVPKNKVTSDKQEHVDVDADKQEHVDADKQEHADADKQEHADADKQEHVDTDKQEHVDPPTTATLVDNKSLKLVLSGKMEALERKKRRRTEIFIRGLRRDTTEADIRKIFEEVGQVVDVTLSKNKGFAFLRYASAADANKALQTCAKLEISGKQCGVSLVEGNDTIYLGNIDKNWKTEDVIDLLKKARIENIDKVTVMADPNNIEQNRGFAFVELETSKDAKIAFNKLQKKDVFGTHVKVKVAWAQPLTEPNEEEILKVKSVYAEYLPSSWNEDEVQKYFGKFGEIESIALAKDLPSSKRKDFGFINYIQRESALACVEAFNHEPASNSEFKGNMKVSLANPMPKSKLTKRAAVQTKKEPFIVKKSQGQPISRRHEPREKVNYRRQYNEAHRMDRGSSTNFELLHLLRQQATAGQIHSGLNIGSSIDHQYSLSGGKRPFSVVADNSHRKGFGGVTRVRVESSFPTASQSMLPHSHTPLGTASFAYYRQLSSGHSPGSVYGVESFPSSFESLEQGPYGGYSHIYSKY